MEGRQRDRVSPGATLAGHCGALPSTDVLVIRATARRRELRVASTPPASAMAGERLTAIESR
jgi:hypothetical protein